jgi:hypothetical protein
MSKSAFVTQQCKCGSKERAKIAVSVAAATLGVVPRRKSKTITLYLCSRCTKHPKPKTIRAIAAAVAAGATKADRRPHRAKPSAAKMSSGAHRRPNSGPKKHGRNSTKLRRIKRNVSHKTARSRKRMDASKRPGIVAMGKARRRSNRIPAINRARGTQRKAGNPATIPG